MPHHDPTTPNLDRRRFLGKLALAGIGAPLLASAAAQMAHQHGDDHTPGMQHMGMHMGAPSIGPDVLPSAKIPWSTGICAFCNMTIATPEGGALPRGFRERTYAQIRLVDGQRIDGNDTLHFESVACMVNYAYARDLRDGHGATFYVADERAGSTPEHGLLLGRDARYLWAEGLQVSMAAKLAAYPTTIAATERVAQLDVPGRHYLLSAQELYDLAPLPEMNLVPLLARATGLLD